MLPERKRCYPERAKGGNFTKKIDYTKYKTLIDLTKAVREQGMASTSAEARKVIADIIPKESYFQTKILKYLRSLEGVFSWKEHSGGFQRSGMPDIGCIVGGMYFGFEVKRPLIGKISDIQAATIEGIRQAGGRAYVVSYVSEVQEILGGYHGSYSDIQQQQR